MKKLFFLLSVLAVLVVVCSGQSIDSFNQGYQNEPSHHRASSAREVNSVEIWVRLNQVFDELEYLWLERGNRHLRGFPPVPFSWDHVTGIFASELSGPLGIALSMRTGEIIDNESRIRSDLVHNPWIKASPRLQPGTIVLGQYAWEINLALSSLGSSNVSRYSVGGNSITTESGSASVAVHVAVRDLVTGLTIGHVTGRGSRSSTNITGLNISSVGNFSRWDPCPQSRRIALAADAAIKDAIEQLIGLYRENGLALGGRPR